MEMPLVLGAIGLVMVAAIVAMVIFRNAAPHDSVAQVMHDVEHPAASGDVRRR
jgi:hypothetical protein